MALKQPSRRSLDNIDASLSLLFGLVSLCFSRSRQAESRNLSDGPGNEKKRAVERAYRKERFVAVGAREKTSFGLVSFGRVFSFSSPSSCTLSLFLTLSSRQRHNEKLSLPTCVLFFNALRAQTKNKRHKKENEKKTLRLQS